MTSKRTWKRIWKFMSKQEKVFITLFIILALLFLFSIPVKVAYPQEAHVGPQVVFKLDHRDSRGRYVMEAIDVRIAYTIEPIEGSHPAPMSENDWKLCRPYNEGPKLYLHCGGDRYAISNIGLIPKEQKKGEE